MAKVALEKINKRYGAVPAVIDVDLAIADNEFVVLVGPSGCGKSTTLRMVAGLEDVTSGTIRIGERVVNGLAPKDRDIAMVFQNYALYQHMTIYDNLAFGLRNRRVAEDVIPSEVARAAEILGIGDLLARKPRQLSGGQQPRAPLGRRVAEDVTRRGVARAAEILGTGALLAPNPRQLSGGQRQRVALGRCIV